MEEKKELNLVEILKDCPEGMELDCTMYEEVTLIHILGGNAYPIKIETPDGQISLNKYGKYSNNKLAKCVIFPKGKTTWEGFQRPFKDGDILSYQCAGRRNRSIYIYRHHSTMNTSYYVALSGLEFRVGDKEGCALNGYNTTARLATEEEKQKLFQAIKDNGYKWNAEAKKVEKLEAEKPKWNPDTLQPFDKVLVRDDDSGYWGGDFYLYTDEESGSEYINSCVSSNYKICIPYNEETKHLLGTNQEAPEFYRL